MSRPTPSWRPTHGKVVVAQRTGLIARRIVQRAPVGALLAKGERFGLIRFGSRTDVYLPADAAEPPVAPATACSAARPSSPAGQLPRGRSKTARPAARAARRADKPR